MTRSAPSPILAPSRAASATGYFTVSRDGLWGLIRADGEEVLPCEAPVPITRCGGGWHWILLA